MDQMQNLNSYLSQKVMQETLHGGPAHYRQAHQGTNPNAQHLAELKQGRADQAEGRHRLLTLKLPGPRSVSVRLPKWALVGRLSA
jgi:hypothetical protein